MRPSLNCNQVVLNHKYGEDLKTCGHICCLLILSFLMKIADDCFYVSLYKLVSWAVDCSLEARRVPIFLVFSCVETIFHPRQTLEAKGGKENKMGGSPSKKIEEVLQNSSAFHAAVEASFEDCMGLAQHAFPGLQAYQLLDASSQVYVKMALDEGDIASRYKERLLPHPPTQFDVDKAVQKERPFEGGRKALPLKEFHAFAITLFRDMGLSTAYHRLALYVPMGGIAVLCAHETAKRLPIIGPVYRAAGPLMPTLLLASVLGVVVSKQLSPS